MAKIGMEYIVAAKLDAADAGRPFIGGYQWQRRIM